MDLLKWWQVVLASAMLSKSLCMPIALDDPADFKLYYYSSYDSNAAMDFLHSSLPRHMSMQERCKRYAILAHRLSNDPGRMMTLSALVKFSPEEINQRYNNLNEDELGPDFMAAIDAYRAASYLGPPFLELIECLRLIDKPYVKEYLNNPELVLIEDWHKQLIRSPGTMFDLNEIDPRFTAAFRTSLRMLFKENLLDHTSDGSTYPGRYKVRDAQSMVTSHRKREQERLRKRRLITLQPDVERTKKRLQYERKRTQRRMIQGQRQIVAQRLGARLRDPIFLSTSRPPLTGESSQQQQHRDELTPDLLRDWSAAAAVYESIATPQQEPSETSEIRDLLSMVDVAKSPPSEIFPTTGLNQSQEQQSMQLGQKQPDPPSVQSISDSPAPLLAEQISTRQIVQPGLLGSPMAPFPFLSQPNSQQAATSSIMRDLGSENQTHNYPIDSEAQSQFVAHPSIVGYLFPDIAPVSHPFSKFEGDDSNSKGKEPESSKSDKYDS